MTGSFSAQKWANWSARGLLLWLLPLPLVPALFVALLRGNIGRFIGILAALVLFWLGAQWLRRGLQQEREYAGRTVGRAPRVPKKLLGTVMVTLGTLSCSWLAVGQSPFLAALIAALAFLGCYLSYGLDPRRDKTVPIADGFGYSSEEILAAVEAAETKISAIEAAARRFSNRELLARLERITSLARRIVANLETDPRDLRRTRKFINVYLDGAMRVTSNYAQTIEKTGSGELTGKYRELLVTIEEVFQQQHDGLLRNDVNELDIQMEVLMKQLRHEGIL